MYFDNEHLNHIINKINKSKSIPFNMANEELVDQFFPYIKERFSETIMIKLGIEQYITVNKRGQNALIKGLKECKKKYEKTISEIDLAIKNLS